MRVSESIEKLVPYKPGKPIDDVKREFGLEKVYKLASNENPLGVSEKVQEAVRQEIANGFRYPDPGFYKLRQVFANHFQLSPENLTFGNGSNEVIDLLIRLYCQPGDQVITSEYAFIAYKVCAQAAGVQVVAASVDSESLAVDLNKVESLVKENDRARLVFLPNPNNPTGTYFSHSELESFLVSMEEEEVLVVMDEAYCEYVTAQDYPKTLELFKQFKNLAFIRTMSKGFGLAGFRVGVLVAHPEVVSYVDRIRNPFNVNHLAQVAAVAALKDHDFLVKTRKMNSEGLEFFYSYLSKLGLKFWKSQTNFVLVDFNKPVDVLQEKLLERGVIFRPLKGYQLHHHLRMSVGLPEENEYALQQLESILENGSW